MARTHSCHEIIPLLQHHTNLDLNNSYSEDSSRSSNDCFTTLVQVCHEEKQFHGQKKIYVRPCESCGIDHDGNYGTGRFCSSACAHRKGGLGRARQMREERSKRIMSISEITRTEPQCKQPSKRKTKEQKQRWPGKGYKVCIHCRQKVPSRLRRCSQCSKEFQNPVSVSSFCRPSTTAGMHMILPKWSPPNPTMWTALMLQSCFNPPQQ